MFRLFRQQSQQNIRSGQQSVELYPDQNTFEFDQGHVTKNQPITVLVLLSERLGIYKAHCVTKGKIRLLSILWFLKECQFPDFKLHLWEGPLNKILGITSST